MVKKAKKASVKRIGLIVAVVLAAVLVAGLFTTLFVKLDRQTNFTTIGGEAYSIGTLDEDGEYLSGDTAIYMRKAITTNGLKCELADNAKIKYQIFFYTQSGKFISATEELTTDYNGTDIPAKATQAKIMITPTDDSDGRVSLVEVLGYASQLTVTVSK